MECTILSHNVETGEAKLRFEHNDVVFEADYNLKLVVPGSEYILKRMGIEFNEEHQLKALENLKTSIAQQIEDGVQFTPPPVTETEYVAPVEEPAKTPKTSKTK